MNQILQNAERLFEAPQPAPPAIGEYEKEQHAIRANHQRLKAERLARKSALTSTAL